MRAWTLEEVHRLPDDGNKYELVRGELFVTPATVDHETIIARLARVLEPPGREGFSISTSVLNVPMSFIVRPTSRVDVVIESKRAKSW